MKSKGPDFRFEGKLGPHKSEPKGSEICTCFRGINPPAPSETTICNCILTGTRKPTRCGMLHRLTGVASDYGWKPIDRPSADFSCESHLVSSGSGAKHSSSPNCFKPDDSCQTSPGLKNCNLSTS